MRLTTPFFVVALLALSPAYAADTQIADPIAAPIVKQGLMVEIQDVVRLPGTRGMIPLEQDVSPAGWARVNFVHELPDGRRFANDQRGFLYLLDGGEEPTVYADFSIAFPLTIYSRLQSGFIGFAFHPEFAENGLFYTAHGERAFANPRAPDFIPPGFSNTDVS
ncbi:MAG: PQQ-dependent sugar dehydrogenase, partial [Alphaproteobacteria bacterium]